MIVHAHIYMSDPKNSIMRPSKPIGPILETAESLKDQKGDFGSNVWQHKWGVLSGQRKIKII